MNFYKKLLVLRKTYPSLCAGEYLWVDENSNDYIAFLRVVEGEAILIILNFSQREINFNFDFSRFGISTNKVDVLISNCRNENGSVTGILKISPVEIFVGKLT